MGIIGERWRQLPRKQKLPLLICHRFLNVGVRCDQSVGHLGFAVDLSDQNVVNGSKAVVFSPVLLSSFSAHSVIPTFSCV